MLSLPIRSYGSLAAHTLRNHLSARVQGSISKGVFLLFPDRKVVFISYQAFEGPLNLTLADSFRGLPLPVQVGDQVQVSIHQIRFPDSHISLDLRLARLWTTPPPPAQSGNMREHLDHLARRAYAARPEDGWSALLPYLLGWEAVPELPDALRTPLTCLLEAREALHKGNIAAALQRLTQITGLGRGLTPSGDDCLSGLLLMRARSGSVPPKCDPLAAPLVQASYEGSTAISANILEAAAQGEAEERLLAACDAILAGRVGNPDILNGLLEYGSSSGIDALVGMAVGIS